MKGGVGGGVGIPKGEGAGEVFGDLQLIHNFACYVIDQKGDPPPPPFRPLVKGAIVR